MIKFIVPVIIVFLITLFWEKISGMVYKKFNLRLSYLIISATLLIVAIIILLIKY